MIPVVVAPIEPPVFQEVPVAPPEPPVLQETPKVEDVVPMAKARADIKRHGLFTPKDCHDFLKEDGEFIDRLFYHTDCGIAASNTIVKRGIFEGEYYSAPSRTPAQILGKQMPLFPMMQLSVNQNSENMLILDPARGWLLVSHQLGSPQWNVEFNLDKEDRELHSLFNANLFRHITQVVKQIFDTVPNIRNTVTETLTQVGQFPPGVTNITLRYLEIQKPSAATLQLLQFEEDETHGLERLNPKHLKA